MSKYKVNLKAVEVDGDFLDSIITTAVEGGTNYWAYCMEYEWEGVEQTSAKLVEMEDYDENESDATVFTITRDSVINALQKILDEDRFYVSDYIMQAVKENDAGYIDANDADYIVQVACYGEVVYG
jgi:hypothetical protein